MKHRVSIRCFFITFESEIVEQFSHYTTIQNMKSTIRVEMDFDTMQPVLRITHDKTSDDLRDQTLKYFLEKAGMNGAVMYLTYPNVNDLVRDTTISEIRCEIYPEAKGDGSDELDFIREAKARALTYTKTEQERNNVAAFFDGWDAKASIKMLQENGTLYKEKHSI